MIQLSILICSTHARRNTFLPKCLEMIYGQYEQLPEAQQNEVEIIVLTDNKRMMLGDKRNVLIGMAQGEYVVFIDDDDIISDDYIAELLNATNTNADVITFKVDVTINGGNKKTCIYSKSFNQDRNLHNSYERLPNHICCVKKEVSQLVSFPNIKYGEDSVYAKLLKPHLKTEHFINKVLYHYDYNEMTTEAQEDMPSVVRKRKTMQPSVVDVVILSNAKNEGLKKLTQQTVDTCIAGANGLNVNVIVIEQQPNISYNGAKLIFHNAPFNYNAFMNLGAAHGNSDWVMFCNNDLVFTNGWLHNLLVANYPVVSPKCPNDNRQINIIKNEKGFVCGKHLSGWAFMMKRGIYNQIGGLDEDFNFWFADNSTIGQLKRIGIAPMIVSSSIVKHIGSTTLKTLPNSEQSDLAWSKCEHYNNKYSDNLFENNPNYLEWKKRQSVSA